MQAEQVVVNVASGSATVGGPRPAELDDLFGPTSQDDELEQQKVQKRFLELQRRSKDQDTTATTRNSFRHRYLMRTKTPPPRSDELRHEQELRAHFLKSSKERHKLFYSWFLPGTTVAFFLITFFDVLQEGEARRVEALEIACGGCVDCVGVAWGWVVRLWVWVWVFTCMSQCRFCVGLLAGNYFSSAAPVPPVKKERKNTDIPS